VQNILSNTSRSVEQVTIEPDGKWSQHSKAASPNNNNSNNHNTSFGSDDEELIEIQDSRVTALKMASTPVPSVGSARTPPMSSREASASATSTHASTSSKRPASQIIDLTLSDDDDDLPVSRPAKRQFTGYGTPQSMPTSRSAPNGLVQHGMVNGRSSLNGS
jgi:E3 SUMO-protein ligase PIAS1